MPIDWVALGMSGIEVESVRCLRMADQQSAATEREALELQIAGMLRADCSDAEIDAILKYGKETN